MRSLGNYLLYMENTTRISDLPENITMQQPQQMSMGGFDQSSSTNYIPINLHPNPYGISAQNPIMPIPQQPNVQQVQQVQQLEQMASVQRQQQLSEQQQTEIQQIPQFRLPSRDVVIDTATYMNDNQIHANYIPTPKLTKDYILDYEDNVEKNIVDYEKKKHRENLIDEILSEMQLPVFVTVLFFLFQLPIVNTLVFKKFSFLSIYSDDGNFNIYGLLLKSILFGSLFFSVNKVVTFISEW